MPFIMGELNSYLLVSVSFYFMREVDMPWWKLAPPSVLRGANMKD